jgi:hypothetical protein
MKPQSLQDAIKAQALRKEKARQSGGWKEPVVKQHKVTAEELQKSPRRMQVPLDAPPIYMSSPTSPTGVSNNIELVSLKKMLSEMQAELKRQRNDITALQNENRRLQETIESMSSEKENIKAKQPASLEPHSEKDLAEGQRLDKALRHFIKTKQGLYDVKFMSTREEKGHTIVCFKKKIYIPENLRSKTIKHYKRFHPTDEIALTSLKKNCCWPDMEKDFFDPSRL